MKKISLIILILLIILGGVWLWWRQGAEPEPLPIGTNNSGGGLFFPSGQVDNTPTGNLSTGGGTLGVGNNTNASGTSPISTFSNLNKVYDKPIAGVAQIASSTVLLMDKATGHLYAIDTGNNLAVKQISNTTIPKVNDFLAGQTADKLMILARYLKDDRPQNFAAGLVKTFGSSTEPFKLGTDEIAELEGSFLSPNMYEVTASPDKDRIFYLEKNTNGQATGYLANWDGSGRSLLFSSPLTEWLVSWPSPEVIALQTKTSASTESSLYFLDPKTKQDRLVFSGIAGLSSMVNSSGRKTLYSGNSSQGLVFGVYTLAEGFFDRLPVTTLAEKCVWSKDNITVYCGVPQRLPLGPLPDSWYQGETSLADNIWKLDTETKQGEIIYNPGIARLGQDIDLSHLFLNPTETTLFFTNKIDQQLWALNLEPGF